MAYFEVGSVFTVFGIQRLDLGEQVIGLFLESLDFGFDGIHESVAGLAGCIHESDIVLIGLDLSLLLLKLAHKPLTRCSCITGCTSTLLAAASGNCSLTE